MSSPRRRPKPPPPLDVLAESGALLASLEHTITELHDFIAGLRAEVTAQEEEPHAGA